MRFTGQLTVSALLLGASATTASAQSTFAGRVLTDSGAAISGAEVVLNGPQTLQRTNERGEFRFLAVPAGIHVVGARMPGFAPRIDTIEVADAGDLRRDFRLTRITSLPEVPVRATILERKLTDFYERRRFSSGRFLDSAEFANTRGTRTSDRIARLPGLVIVRGRFSNEAYVANIRSRTRAGTPLCRAAIWIDNINVGTSYNINELDPSAIAAVEWYAGPASTPAQFSQPPRRGETYCGVLVIWLR